MVVWVARGGGCKRSLEGVERLCGVLRVGVFEGFFWGCLGLEGCRAYDLGALGV